MRLIIYGLMLIFLTACGKNEQAQSNPARETTAVAMPAPVPAPAGFYPPSAEHAEFDFTPEQFASMFNATSQAYEQRFRIKKVKIKEGEVNNVFQYYFSERLTLTAGISKSTGRVLNMTTIMVGDGKTKQQAIDMLVMSMILTKATNPTLTGTEILEMVTRMNQEPPGQEGTSERPERTINNVHYILESGHGIGYWWIMNPV